MKGESPEERLREYDRTREWWIAGWLCAYVTVAAWCLGGVRASQQFLLLVPAAMAFAGLFLPFGEFGLRKLLVKANVKALLRHPVWWLGLALAAWLLLQEANPAYRYQTNGEKWWLLVLEPVSWLPQGIDGPFRLGNSFRELLFLGAPFLGVLALAIGIRRRLPLQTILIVMVFNALGVALIGMVQTGMRLQGVEAQKLLFLFPPESLDAPERHPFFGSFVGRNQAAAFLNLNASLAFGLAILLWGRSLRRGLTGGPHFIFSAAGALLGVGAIATASRAGVIFGLAVFLVAILALFVTPLRFGRKKVAAGILIISLAGAAILGVALYKQGSLTRIAERFDQMTLFKSPEEAAELRPWERIDDRRRILLAKLALRAIDENTWQGQGPSGFAYFSPQVMLDWFPDEETLIDPIAKRKGVIQLRALSRHVHNDWLEYPMEYGAGAFLMLAMLLYWPIEALCRHCRLGPLQILGGFGCALTLLHAVVDFPFQSGSILAFFSLIWAGLARTGFKTREA